MNIYDFIRDPQGCIRKGYHPGYLSCVSLFASKYPNEALNFMIKTIVHLLEVRLKHVPLHLLIIFRDVVIVITFPLLMWVLALVQYSIIKNSVRRDRNEKS